MSSGDCRNNIPVPQVFNHSIFYENQGKFSLRHTDLSIMKESDENRCSEIDWNFISENIYSKNFNVHIFKREACSSALYSSFSYED